MKSIQIQIKSAEERSKAFSIQGKNVQDTYNKIKFLFDSLEQVEESVDLKVYK